MAIVTNIERLNYYEGEFLGAADFDAEQEYHRDMRRRHNIGQHTWGIVAGLDLAQVPNGSELDLFLMPGMAVDGFGREIVVLGKVQLTQEPFAPYFDPNPAAAPKQMYLWIAYDQSMAQASQDACASAGSSNAFARVVESYRIAVTPDPTSPANDPVIVDGNSIQAGVPPTTAPAPDDVVLPADGAIPFQEFPDSDTVLNWFVPIGRVLWDPHNEVFVNQPAAASAQGRLYAGAIAETIYAPGGALLVVDRWAPDPLPSDPSVAGVAMEVAGSLQVDRSLEVDGLVNALTDVLIGAKANPADKNLSPLTIAGAGPDQDLIQFRNPTGGETWHICQDLGGANPGINVAEIAAGNPVDARLFIQSTITTGSPASPRNIGVGTLTPRNPLGIRSQGASQELLSFEDPTGATKWHLNQNLKVGAAFTPGLNFAETSVADARLFLQPGGNVGIGTAIPQQNLSVAAGLNLDQANVNAGTLMPGLTFGSTSGEGIASRRTGGTNQYGLDFYTGFALRMSIAQNGNIGVGTNVPDSPLHVAGGNSNLDTTEGDFKIGNPGLRLKMGVTLGGPGAGDARIRAQGGTSRLILGSAADDTLTISGPSVGINTTTPAGALDVDGDTTLAGKLTVNGAVVLTGAVKINGGLTVTGAKSGYVADRFVYRGDEPLRRGDVVVLHSRPATLISTESRIPLIEIMLSDKAGDPAVCGIVDEPQLDAEQLADLDLPRIKGARIGLMVTLGAYAFCRVDATESAVKPGDLLTTGSSKGCAAKIRAKTEVKAGTVIGKALGALAKGNIGLIPILVSQQ
jgi:hypothetical protein